MQRAREKRAAMGAREAKKERKAFPSSVAKDLRKVPASAVADLAENNNSFWGDPGDSDASARYVKEKKMSFGSVLCNVEALFRRSRSAVVIFAPLSRLGDISLLFPFLFLHKKLFSAGPVFAS